MLSLQPPSSTLPNYYLQEDELPQECSDVVSLLPIETGWIANYYHFFPSRTSERITRDDFLFIFDPDGRENRRSCENASENKMGIGTFGQSMYSKVDTTRHFQSIQTLKGR
jgi:hypothetical protein